MKFQDSCWFQPQMLEVSPLSGGSREGQEVQYNFPSDHRVEPKAELPVSISTEATDE